MWAVHGFLVPRQRVVAKDNDGKNTITRFTIADSQESFICNCKSFEELEDQLRFKKSKSEHIQPFILTVGENIRSIKDIIVYFDNLKIPSKSLIRAVDICFKIYYLFNLQYPKACSTFWNFIQVFFYNIKSKEKYAKVNIIVNELKKRQEIVI